MSLHASFIAHDLPYSFLLAVIFPPDCTCRYHQLDINCNFGMWLLNVGSSENTAATNSLFIRDNTEVGTNSHCCFALEIKNITTKDYASCALGVSQCTSPMKYEQRRLSCPNNLTQMVWGGNKGCTYMEMWLAGMKNTCVTSGKIKLTRFLFCTVSVHNNLRTIPCFV